MDPPKLKYFYYLYAKY